MWKIIYEAPKGMRVNRYFRSVTVEGENHLWFEEESGVWKEDCKDFYSSHHSESNRNFKVPKTVKAFKRYLKKHPELKGNKVWLINSFRCWNNQKLHVYAEWVE